MPQELEKRKTAAEAELQRTKAACEQAKSKFGSLRTDCQELEAEARRVGIEISGDDEAESNAPETAEDQDLHPRDEQMDIDEAVGEHQQ